MMPLSVKVSPSDLFVKDKYVSEEIRNLAMETQCVTVTASQLNRAAVEEIEFDHSHISGGLSKIMTADNVIGIFTSRAMKERGRYQGLKRTSNTTTETVDADGVVETRDPTQGINIAKPKPKAGAPLIRNMLNSINPEKD
jgi:hypothetical protein